ncbi:MAG: replicative DNA helicase [Candidatus Gastranaerophilales bacterium]|nr:replicative DNA helicase [Candidatus Gastranaerophilales bacterium]
MAKAEKIPPQSIEAEENVLGALLINPHVIPRIVEILSSPDIFYDPAHGQIYASILDLFNNTRPIDIITVSEDLNTKGLLKSVGGRAKINDLALHVVTTANAEYYAKIVAEKSSLRDLINAGADIVEMAYEEGQTGTVLELAEQAIFSIAQKRTKSDLIHIKDIVGDSYEQIEHRYNNSGELAGISSGFYDLDNITFGFQKSDLIILAARPSMGKTAFALNIAQHVGVKEKKPVLVFSLEMKKDQLVQRMLCSEAEIDSSRLKSGRMQANDWIALSEAMGSLSEAPIYIDDTPGLTITDLRAKCRRLSMKTGQIGLVIIDYLQLMEGTVKAGNDNRVQVISAISRGLKGIAREIDVPVLALSQLSRDIEKRTDKSPMLSDLRESGSIEQDADIVMFIHREEYYDKDNSSPENKGKAEVVIAKQRNGAIGKVELLFQSSITKFKNKAVRTEVF